MMDKNNSYELVCYNTDDSGMFGEASRVVFPRDVEDVIKIVFDSQDLVPRGLGSNVVGGCVPSNSVVVDMKNMNEINFDFKSEIVCVGPGVTIKELNEKLKQINYEFPIICNGTIGGIVAMNRPGLMGGYGNIKEWIEEIEFVNGRGELTKFGKAEIGEVCGLEGITGIITKIKLKVIPLVERSASIFQSNDIEEVFVVAKRLRLEKHIVMLRFYSPYFSKLLGFPEKYHIIVGFDNEHGKIKDNEYIELFNKIRKDYYKLYKEDYRDSEDPKFLFEKVKEFVLFLDKFNVPYSGDLNLGIIYPFFNDDLKKQEVVKMIDRMNGRPGSYGIGLKRKKRIDNLQKKIIRRIKLRHDPFLKLNKGKLIDIEDSSTDENKDIKKDLLKTDSNQSPEENMKKFIENTQMEEVGNVSMKDNFDDKIDKKLMDRILFNKDDEDESDNKK
jgi:hypothetical protein